MQLGVPGQVPETGHMSGGDSAGLRHAEDGRLWGRGLPGAEGHTGSGWREGARRTEQAAWRHPGSDQAAAHAPETKRYDTHLHSVVITQKDF